MLRLEKVATPLTAATVAVPDSVPLAGLLPIASAMLAVEPATVFPAASCTVTLTAGLMEAPAATREGCTLKANFAAAPLATTLKVVLVAPVSPLAVAASV